MLPCLDCPGLFCRAVDQQAMALFPEWISDYMNYKCEMKLIIHFPNFNGGASEVWDEINNFIPHFMMDVITYPCWDYS